MHMTPSGETSTCRNHIQKIFSVPIESHFNSFCHYLPKHTSTHDCKLQIVLALRQHSLRIRFFCTLGSERAVSKGNGRVIYIDTTHLKVLLRETTFTSRNTEADSERYDCGPSPESLAQLKIRSRVVF